VTVVRIGRLAGFRRFDGEGPPRRRPTRSWSSASGITWWRSSRPWSFDLLFAPVVELGGACGHPAIWCEEAEVFPLIARFLEE